MDLGRSIFEPLISYNNYAIIYLLAKCKLQFSVSSVDGDMTTLNTTKNIAYMYICEVISSANYTIIYLCHPGQKYFTNFCVMSNCRCMGHLYNPHMKIREKEKFR